MGRKRVFESKSDTLCMFSECTMYVEILSVRMVAGCLSFTTQATSNRMKLLETDDEH